MLTWHFLYARYCSHFFANVNTLNINNLMRIIVVISIILAQHTQFARGRAETQAGAPAPSLHP